MHSRIMHLVVPIVQIKLPVLYLTVHKLLSKPVCRCLFFWFVCHQRLIPSKSRIKCYFLVFHPIVYQQCQCSDTQRLSSMLPSIWYAFCGTWVVDYWCNYRIAKILEVVEFGEWMLDCQILTHQKFFPWSECGGIIFTWVGFSALIHMWNNEYL